MNQHCFICNSKTSNSARGVLNLFEDNVVLLSGKSLVGTVCKIIDKQITKEKAHSSIICRKCYNVCVEYDAIINRLESIKSEFLDVFEKTLQINNLNYEGNEMDINGKLSNKIDDSPEKRFDGKKVVVQASKLQPLPPNYLIKVGNITPAALKPKPIVITPSVSTLNLKVTVGSSVLTQSIKTTSPAKPLRRVVLQNRSDTETSPIKISSDFATLTNLTNKNESNESTSLDGFNSASITLLNKDSLEYILGLNVNNSKSTHFTDSKRGDDVISKNVMKSDRIKTENNEEVSMEIAEECSYSVISSNGKTDILKGFDIGSKTLHTEPKDKSNESYFSLIPASDTKVNGGANDKGDSYTLNTEEMSEKEDEDEHTIVMEGENGSILRVVSGNFLYDDDSISLVVPNKSDELNEDGGQDSNDESQIELQVSGDEETANAIIAAAQEQGGAFIKVDSGEMFRVKSVQSKIGDNDKVDHAQLIETVENSNYKCLVCEKNEKEPKLIVGDAKFIMIHMKSEHDARIYVCQICGEVIKKRSDYSTHIASHAKKSDSANSLKAKVHECNICNRKFSSRTMLTEHSNVHTGKCPYVCPLCNKAFASKYTHHSHLKTHLERPRPFKCEECGKSFLTQQNLSQHEKTHSGVKDFICNICNKAFGTQHNLEMHGVVHSGNKPFVCEVCNKAFARRAEVKDHMRIHTGERPFACDICGATFSQRSNLQSHKRATHLDDKRYACDQCDKKFKRRRLLDYHIKASHTGERPLQCEVCHATFVYPEHYKKHIRIHSGEKPFQCEVCGKSFNSRDNRNTHRFVHSDKKPYECVVCGAGFMRKQLLYAHMNSRGHLAESIVVNQPRVTRVDDSVVTSVSSRNERFTEVFEVPETLELDVAGDKSVGNNSQYEETTKIFMTSDKQYILQEVSGKQTLNLVQDSAEPALLTFHNIEDGVKSEGTFLEAVDADPVVSQTPVNIVSEDSGGMLRLVQIQLADGNNGWVAINS